MGSIEILDNKAKLRNKVDIFIPYGDSSRMYLLSSYV